MLTWTTFSVRTSKSNARRALQIGVALTLLKLETPHALGLLPARAATALRAEKRRRLREKVDEAIDDGKNSERGSRRGIYSPVESQRAAVRGADNNHINK